MCEAAAALALGVALVAAWTGGWHTELIGVAISVRALWRPLLVAGAAVAIRGWLLRRDATPLASGIDVAARVIAGAFLVAGAVSWTTYLSPTVGGADSYGYVGASDRLRAGALVQDEPLARVLPYPGAISAATPLGFVTSLRVPDASAPAYPLGLPALMAAATIVLGERGPFHVSLLMGIVLLLAAYRITRRWFDDVVALTACAALAFYPVVFAYAIQPMSDVPAAAWFLVAIACLLTGRLRFAWLAGFAAAAAFLTRPALFPGLAALTAVAVGRVGLVGRVGRVGKKLDVPASPLGPVQWPRLLAYMLPLGCAAVLQAWLQWYLYGSVSATGYGSSRDLFSLAFLGVNTRSYAYWGAMMNGPIWIAALAAGLVLLRDRSARLVMAAVVFGAIVPYAIYRPYDHWETLRFLLPMLVVSTIVSTGGVMLASRRLAQRHAGTIIGVLLTIGSIAMWIAWLDRQQVLIMAVAEERYRLAGELVERVTPPNAVVLTSLHSGSIRYYAHRATVDWANIPAGQFAPSVAALEQHGHPVFLLIDGPEAALFAAQHGDAYANWLPAGQRRDVRLYEAP